MKKNKTFLTTMASICCLSIVFICVLFSCNKAEIIISDNGYEMNYVYNGKEIKIFGQKIKDDNYIHFFVPSYFNVNKIVIKNKNFEIENGYYTNNVFLKSTSGTINDSRAIKIKTNEEEIIIHFLKNPTLYIDLKNKTTIEELKTNKDKRYKCSIKLLDKDGQTLFNGNAKYIKGRGNTSWVEEKKPYNIEFNNNVNLMGMGYSNKYCLIASYFDMTGIRNKLVLNYADELGLDYTPKSEYVNVYINGIYEGLYLMCHHVSVDDNLSIKKNNDNNLLIKNNNIGKLKEIRYYDNKEDSKTKNYLIERESEDRYKNNNKDAGFITSRNNTYLIHNAGTMSFKEINTIAQKVEKLEESLYKPSNVEYLKMIDIDSWAKQYLIEALFQNEDSYGTSSYFYFNREEGIFYGGPVWDYDFSIGYGASFIQNPKTYHLLNNTLSKKEDLMKKVIDIFNTQIYINKEKLMYGETENLKNSIKEDMYLNSLRYNQDQFIVSNYIYENYDYDAALERLQGHLYERIEYLNQIYNSGKTYRRVNLNTNNIFCGTLTYLVEEGSSFISNYAPPYLKSGDGFVWPESLWISKWVDKDGNEFDFTKPITEDVELYAVWEGDTDANILQK